MQCGSPVLAFKQCFLDTAACCLPALGHDPCQPWLITLRALRARSPPLADPISAFNISQAQQLAGRKLLLTERGVAEGLARGTIQVGGQELHDLAGGVHLAGHCVRLRSSMSLPAKGLRPPTHPLLPQMVPCDRRQRPGGSSWNPLAPLLTLASRLADGRRLTKSVQERAAALDRAAGGRAADKDAGASTSASTSNSPVAEAQASRTGGPSASATSTSPGGRAGSSASNAAPADQPEEAEQQYYLEDVPVRRMLAGGAPPQLAWVPLRVALAMLHDLPQHFMLLQGALQAPKQARPKHRQHQPGTAAEGRQQGRAGQHTQPGGAAQQPAAFATVTSPAGMEVFVLPVRPRMLHITVEGCWVSNQASACSDAN